MAEREGGGFTPELVETCARAMQVKNRPSNDCRNRDQREADEDASLDGYCALATTCLEASGIAELTEALREAREAMLKLDGGGMQVAEYLNLALRIDALLAKIGGTP